MTEEEKLNLMSGITFLFEALEKQMIALHYLSENNFKADSTFSKQSSEAKIKAIDYINKFIKNE